MASYLYTDDTPAEVKNAKGLVLITSSTPNGQAPQIMLEELKEKYGLEWTTISIDIDTNVQKADWFLRLNPNGRIPVLIDNNQSTPFPVFETSALLLYLLKFDDKYDAFGFKDEFERSECLQWLFFFHGGVAPVQGQVNHFRKYAPEKVPYAEKRYVNETLRVYDVLESRLAGRFTGEKRDWLAGVGKGKYSVADIKAYPWVAGWRRSLFTEEDMKPLPHLMAWLKRCVERPAVQAGMSEKYDKKTGDYVFKAADKTSGPDSK